MLTPNDIRTYIKDRPEYNRLLDKEEFSQEQINLAMNLCVSEFNEVPPLTSFLPENFPFSNVMLVGVLAHLLRGAGLARTRNRLQYSTGGVSIDDEAAAPVYLELATALFSEYQSKSQRLKIYMNIASGWGYVPSEYNRAPKYRNI